MVAVKVFVLCLFHVALAENFLSVFTMSPKSLMVHGFSEKLVQVAGDSKITSGLEMAEGDAFEYDSDSTISIDDNIEFAVGQSLVEVATYETIRILKSKTRHVTMFDYEGSEDTSGSGNYGEESAIIDR